MKKITKLQSIIISVVVLLVILAGCFFAFVPFNCGTKDYSSFLKNIEISSDLKEGMFAEYTISSASTDQEIESSIEKMRSILSDEGFVNANVFRKGEDKIRIEIMGAKNSYDSVQYQSVLTALAGGLFELRAGNDDNVINIIDASKHMKNVTISSSGTSYYILMELNETGKKVYKDLTAESIDSYSGSVYMFLNDTEWPNSSYNSFKVDTVVTDGQIALSVASRDYAEQFALAIKSGSLSIELDSENAVIANITPILGEHTLLIISLIALGIAIALFVLYIALFRANGIVYFVSTLVSVVVALFLFQAMSWVELDISSIFALGVCYILIAFTSFVIFNDACRNYLLGKQASVALDSANKNNIKLVCDLSIIPGLFGMVLAIVGNAQLQTLGTILVVYGLLNMLQNLLLNRWFLNLFIGVFGDKAEFFGFKKEGVNNEISK